jgi:hypothetical protein
VDDARNSDAIARKEIAKVPRVALAFLAEGARHINLTWYGIAMLDEVELHASSTHALLISDGWVIVPPKEPWQAKRRRKWRDSRISGPRLRVVFCEPEVVQAKFTHVAGLSRPPKGLVCQAKRSEIVFIARQTESWAKRGFWVTTRPSAELRRRSYVTRIGGAHLI